MFSEKQRIELHALVNVFDTMADTEFANLFNEEFLYSELKKILADKGDVDRFVSADYFDGNICAGIGD